METGLVTSETEPLFAEPIFSSLLEHWQLAQLHYNDGLREYTGHDFLAGEDLSDEAIARGDQFERIIGMTAEQLEREYYPDELKAAGLQYMQAEAILLEFTRSTTTSQFVLFAMRRSLGLTLPDISKHVILANVKKVEDRFLSVDNLVRNNPGELLTVLDNSYGKPSVIASRLGAGGITLTEDHIPEVELPKQSPQQFVGHVKLQPSYQPFWQNNDSGPFRLRAEDVARRDPAILTPEEMLDPANWPYNGLIVVAGSIPEGSPVIKKEEDEQFVHGVVRAVRLAGSLVLQSSAA